MTDLPNDDIRGSRSQNQEIVEKQKDNVELLRRKRKAISNARRSKEQVAISNARRPKGSSRSLKQIMAIKHSNKKQHVMCKKLINDICNNRGNSGVAYNNKYGAGAYLEKYGLSASEQAIFSTCTGLMHGPKTQCSCVASCPP